MVETALKSPEPTAPSHIPHLEDMSGAGPLAFSRASEITSDKNRIASISLQMNDKLKKNPGIESVWVEDQGKQINVYINTRDVLNATLDSIFDVRLVLSSQYPHLFFDFELNPVDLDQKQIDHHIQRLI